jgi:hypothetical protein
MSHKQTITPRLIGLGAAVLLESLAVVSVAEHIQLLPIGPAYANIISGVLFLLPMLVGYLSKHWEVALLLAGLPFWALAVVYLFIARPLWDLDVFGIAALAERAAAVSVLTLVLGFAGWLLRRVTPGLATVG